jgi:hypothetical protein
MSESIYIKNVPVERFLEDNSSESLSEKQILLTDNMREEHSTTSVAIVYDELSFKDFSEGLASALAEAFSEGLDPDFSDIVSFDFAYPLFPVIYKDSYFSYSTNINSLNYNYWKISPADISLSGMTGVIAHSNLPGEFYMGGNLSEFFKIPTDEENITKMSLGLYKDVPADLTESVLTEEVRSKLRESSNKDLLATVAEDYFSSAKEYVLIEPEPDISYIRTIPVVDKNTAIDSYEEMTESYRIDSRSFLRKILFALKKERNLKNEKTERNIIFPNEEILSEDSIFSMFIGNSSILTKGIV